MFGQQQVTAHFGPEFKHPPQTSIPYQPVSLPPNTHTHMHTHTHTHTLYTIPSVLLSSHWNNFRIMPINNYSSNAHQHSTIPFSFSVNFFKGTSNWSSVDLSALHLLAGAHPLSSWRPSMFGLKPIHMRASSSNSCLSVVSGSKATFAANPFPGYYFSLIFVFCPLFPDSIGLLVCLQTLPCGCAFTVVDVFWQLPIVRLDSQCVLVPNWMRT